MIYSITEYNDLTQKTESANQVLILIVTVISNLTVILHTNVNMNLYLFLIMGKTVRQIKFSKPDKATNLKQE